MKPIDVLKQYWGYQSFRPLQTEIIDSVMTNRHTLALLPTGGGKSLCFQVPALCMDGLCLVISPLIALMKDQVARLKSLKIRSAAIYSGMSQREIDIILDNCVNGNYKFLYVSPERLQTPTFIRRSQRMNFSFLAIDEAHCISQWGYDFRPSYLQIITYIKTLQIDKCIALTASATREVKKDILEKLEMTNANIFTKSFARPNLSYSAFQLENKESKLLEILHAVPGTSIIYVRSRKKTKEVAKLLQKCGLTADYYNAGLTVDQRDKKQDNWMKNKTRVIVATNAFGMGIDKNNVRSVIHWEMPETLEAYYQEAGRAGRDEKKAYAVVLYQKHDLTTIQERAVASIVEMPLIQRTYQAICNYYTLPIGTQNNKNHDFDYEHFINTYNLPIKDTFYALKKLHNEGLIIMSEGLSETSKLFFLIDRKEVYKYQVEHINLEPVIKTILRLYGGETFFTYVNIKEDEIARLMKTSISQIKKQLGFLHQQKILEYTNFSKKPFISFCSPRMNVKSLPIDQNMIKWRKKLAKNKAKKVVDYLETKKCRTQFLQNYFDEQTDNTCQVCDNDINNKKEQANKKIELDDLYKSLTNSQPLSLIRKKFPDYSDQQILNGLRLLIDENKVIEDNGIFMKIKNEN